VFKTELLKLGKKYKNMVLLVSDVPVNAGIEEFKKFFSDRVFTFGLSSRHMMSAATGFSLRGKLPIVMGYDLLDKTCEQIEEAICAPNLNVRIVDFGGHSHVSPEQLGLNEFKDLDGFVASFDDYGPGYFKC